MNRFFPSPHHQTTPPFTSYLWPMAPPCPILAGYRLVAPGPYACFPFKFVQESACCSCVCRNLEILRLRFLPFMGAFFWSFAPIRSWASYDNGLYISLAHFWFSLLPATFTCNSCRNNSILLDPFLGRPFILFLSGLSQALFLFLLMGSYVPLGFPFGHPRPVC